jgi:hypothetical protein
MKIYGDDELCTAWSRGDFAVRVSNADGKQALEMLYAAATQENPDFALMLGGGGPFQNAGLIMIMPSRLPEETVDDMASQDLGHLDLLDVVEATGIQKKLADADKRYYALSPRWANDDEEKKTKYKCVFWLNPDDQQNNEFGWFTVEELEQWIEGKGPVLKQKESA